MKVCMMKHFAISCGMALCLACSILVGSSFITKNDQAQVSPRITAPQGVVLRYEPKWEVETRSDPSLIWKVFGVSTKQRVLFRIHYLEGTGGFHAYGGQEHQRALRVDDSVSDQQADEEGSRPLSVSVTFEDIYKTILFISSTWVLGNLSIRLGMPSLVGEIVTGFLLGPPLADFVPFPEAMVLVGSFGLIGLILESGIDLDVAQLKETGKRAIVMALTGTVLPLVIGMGLGRAAGEEFKSSIAIGAAFSPSSLGVAANVLSTGDILNTPTGQMIVASSVVDDVLGLILLSILHVFVQEDPKPLDFCLPFLSSFGYLIVLGYSGITWMPYVIEHKIMARFSENYREIVAFCIMLLLLLIYLPLLNYSRASYLTGTFLAGLTFSQINTVHATFSTNGRAILNWLLRIFFAATIGFQVPITRFRDGYVLKWGAKFLLPILVKIPLGLFVPRYHSKLPDDFPYDPYWRDVFITSLALLCRGEFNFIIASFALGEGLIGPDLYSAIVFSVLCASIFGPLLLSRCIHYFNAMSQDYMSGNHPIERDGKTSDGFRPLFLAIQARTPIHWGLQEIFKKTLEDAGLVIIDHRAWHTLGLDAIDITELFVQDTKLKVKVHDCFSSTSSDPPLVEDSTISNLGAASSHPDGTTTIGPANTATSAFVEVDDTAVRNESDLIYDRCNGIKKLLSDCLLSDDPTDYVIQVSQWNTYTFEKDSIQTEGDNEDQQQFYSFNVNHPETILTSPADDIEANRESTFLCRPIISYRRASSLTLTDDASLPDEPHLSAPDLWESDLVSHTATRTGYTMTPVPGGPLQEVTEGLGGANQHPEPFHRRRVPFDASLLAAHGEEMETCMIKERLHGYVRPRL